MIGVDITAIRLSPSASSGVCLDHRFHCQSALNRNVDLSNVRMADAKPTSTHLIFTIVQRLPFPSSASTSSSHGWCGGMAGHSEMMEAGRAILEALFVACYQMLSRYDRAMFSCSSSAYFVC